MITRHENRDAFTLIELIVVLVIVSICAVISIPRVTTGISSAKFRGAVSEVVTFLRNAHLDAIVERNDISVSIDYNKSVLQRSDNKLFVLPQEIALNPARSGNQKVEKYTFYDNGRGIGPRLEFIGRSERKAVVYVDLLSGLAGYDLID